MKKEAAAAAAAQQRNEDDKKSRDQSHGAQHRQAQQSNQESTFRGEQSRGRESEQVRVDVDVNLGQADKGLGAQGQQQAIPANLDQKGPLPAEVQGWTTAISPKRRKGYDSPRQKSKKADLVTLLWRTFSPRANAGTNKTRKKTLMTISLMSRKAVDGSLDGAGTGR